ncbi:DNA-3-methyladenine glycosylase I [Dictyobacter arantiisoli]|uniref:DNA-3-methyladenine glycosylase I n=1 Tax=Dictyobacter arantiisoli TaxID=2014874 RepID=A0A5A5T821_9CHLR|nr:DNA-3-methyladenine glycosylase I [Dictyobacter arantiisoli]GCF07548.1 hypothetical protein KDI_11120 [Dictyobacter arantiisoli]
MLTNSQDMVSVVRCHWALHSPLETVYHDQEWGMPIHDDRILFELLVLETAQAGLSWSTILQKRAGYRRAFADFDPVRVARFDDAMCQSLLLDTGIVRHRQKIAACVQNARAFLQVQEQFGSFAAFVWRFVDGQPIQNNLLHRADVPTRTPISEALSKDLKRRDFAFVGPTICYAFMEAAGLVNDHVQECVRWQAVQSEAYLRHVASLQSSQSAQELERRTAVDALGELADIRAIPALVALLHDVDEGLRVRVVRSLRQIGSPFVFDALREALHDPAPAVRRAAVVALGKLPDERNLPVLLELLQDTDERLRATVVLTIGELGNPQALPALLHLRQQDGCSEQTRAYIVHAIQRIKG